MFVNGLETLSNCYVARDDAAYGKFVCVYTKGGMIREFKQHVKSGFATAAEAIRWYFEWFPAGNLIDRQSFLNLQHQLLELKLPTSGSFDPLHMDIKTPPKLAKRDKTGKLMSDFE